MEMLNDRDILSSNRLFRRMVELHSRSMNRLREHLNHRHQPPPRLNQTGDGQMGTMATQGTEQIVG